jgi:restriction endonuclease
MSAYLKNPDKLDQLLHEYRRMIDLDGFTPQTRGQRLNHFIAELFQCWNIQAQSTLREEGEIDVAFSLGTNYFILEAKWEAKPSDTGALAKLQKRIRQRLGGTIGVFVSIAGYSAEALRELKAGEQLTVLCLARHHLEAMLTGFAAPDEMIDLLVRRAAWRGKAESDLLEIFDSDQCDVSSLARFEHPPEIPELVRESIPSFNAETIISGLPTEFLGLFTGQYGLAEMAEERFLLNNGQELLEINHRLQTITPRLAIPGCSRNPLIQSDGSIFVTRKHGVLRVQTGKMEFVAGGLVGNVCLSSQAGDVCAFSNGMEFAGTRRPPRVVSLGAGLARGKEWEISYPPSQAQAAALVGPDNWLICGNSGIRLESPENSVEILSGRDSPLTNPGAIARVDDDRFVIACNNVDLWQIVLSSRSCTKIASLNLHGSVYELTGGRNGRGYLFSHYGSGNGSCGIVVRWSYS